MRSYLNPEVGKERRLGRWEGLEVGIVEFGMRKMRYGILVSN